MRFALPWFLLLTFACLSPAMASAGDTIAIDTNAALREPRSGRFGLGSYRKVGVPSPPSAVNQAAPGGKGTPEKELRVLVHADLALVGFGGGLEVGGERALVGVEVMRLASVASLIDGTRSTSFSLLGGLPLSRFSSLQVGIGLLTGERTGLRWPDGLSTRGFTTVNVPIRAVLGFAGRNAGIGLRLGADLNPEVVRGLLALEVGVGRLSGP